MKGLYIALAIAGVVGVGVLVNKQLQPIDTVVNTVSQEPSTDIIEPIVESPTLPMVTVEIPEEWKGAFSKWRSEVRIPSEEDILEEKEIKKREELRVLRSKNLEVISNYPMTGIVDKWQYWKFPPTIEGEDLPVIDDVKCPDGYRCIFVRVSSHHLLRSDYQVYMQIDDKDSGWFATYYLIAKDISDESICQFAKQGGKLDQLLIQDLKTSDLTVTRALGSKSTIACM